MVVEPIPCPVCHSINVVKHGKTAADKQRYKCCNPECQRHTFILDYSYGGYLPEVKQQISDMALNGSGIRDTARVLKISPTTVIEALKKKTDIENKSMHYCSNSFSQRVLTLCNTSKKPN